MMVNCDGTRTSSGTRQMPAQNNHSGAARNAALIKRAAVPNERRLHAPLFFAWLITLWGLASGAEV
jgi:hypothetical protein